MNPNSHPPEPTTIPDGAAIITEEDGVVLPLSLSSMSDEGDLTGLGSGFFSRNSSQPN